MRVGQGSSTLPVVPGEEMGGYVDRAGGLDGELDPLQVQALYFASPTRTFTLIVVDLVCVNIDVVAAIRSSVAGLVDSCWVSATHTHASPDAGCHPGGGRTPAKLADRLTAAARSALQFAIAQAADAELEAVRVEVKDFGGRRNGAHPSPQTVPIDVVVARHSDGGVAGLLVVQPVHPTVLSAANRRTSADLNGAVRRALNERVPWAVVATGAAGDLSTRHTRRARDAAEIDRLGALAADAILAGLQSGGVMADGQVGVPREAMVALAPKEPADLPGLAELRDRPGRARTFHQGLELAAGLLERPGSDIEVAVEAVSVGGIELVGVPAELFLCLGERIRSESPRPSSTIVLGYTNGYLGYLPCLNAFAEPDYEVLASPVRRGSGEQVVSVAVGLTEAV